MRQPTAIRFSLAALFALAAARCNTTPPTPSQDLAVVLGDLAGQSPDLAASAECATNGDCASSSVGHVCAKGACVACASDGDCGTNKKCDHGMACVDCLLGADCAAGQRCQSKSCVTGCDSGNNCPMGMKCDPTLRICVACSGDKDCSGATPKCDLTMHVCVGCVSDADCGAGKLCRMASCTTGCSGAHPECPMGQVCNVSAAACVGCLADGDCKQSGMLRCEPKTNTCVACLPSNDNCPVGQYCGANDACGAGCRSDSDCAGMSGTPQCDVPNHACVACVADSACPAGKVCVSHACMTGCTSSQGCPPGQGCCSGACVPIATDNNNCGGCGNVCPDGTGCCGGGTCVPLNTPSHCASCGKTCASGFGCCDQGCVALATDNNHCGSCGNPCSMGSGCCGGVCVSLKTTTNCGTCGNSCSDVVNGTRACANGACGIGACNTGFLHCSMDVSTGCETSAYDVMNCGACKSSCAPVANSSGATCPAGKCIPMCTGTFRDCDGKYDNGCEADLQSDAKNCGMCGKACANNQKCVKGACGIPTSCTAILAQKAGSPDGVYTINPDGKGTDVFDVYCDMSSVGAPWTLVAHLRADTNTHATPNSIGTTPITLSTAGTAKLSDARINAIRGTGDYTGTTNIKMSCGEDGTWASGVQTIYCSKACKFAADQSANSDNCDQCAQAFEGSIITLGPNTGTVGCGDHHANGCPWFAYSRHPFQGDGYGCKSDCRGSGNGHLWVK